MLWGFARAISEGLLQKQTAFLRSTEAISVGSMARTLVRAPSKRRSPGQYGGWTPRLSPAGQRGGAVRIDFGQHFPSDPVGPAS